MTLSLSKKALLAGVSGTALQWYDFALFGYLAPVIAQTYFSNSNTISALLNTFSLFAVGYLLSPLGSVLFGYIGDKYGRKRALLISIFTMAIATALMSIIPGYHSIGLMAPLAITFLRVIQGIVASAEFSGSAIFLVEHAPPNKKAFYGSLTSAAYSVGVIAAGLVTSLLTASFMPPWAWRFGFGGALIASVVILFLRCNVAETPAFINLDPEKKPKVPLLTAIKETPHAFIGVIGLACLIGIMTYTTYVFLPTYLHVYFNFPLSTAALITTSALAVDALLEPYLALWAEKIGYLRMVRSGIILILSLSIPLFYCLSSGQINLAVFAMVGLSMLIALTFAPMNAYMIELFPNHCRTSGFGVAFHIGISLFGGSAPLVLTWLINQTENLMTPAYYMMGGAFVGLLSLSLCEYGKSYVFKKSRPVAAQL